MGREQVVPYYQWEKIIGLGLKTRWQMGANLFIDRGYKKPSYGDLLCLISFGHILLLEHMEAIGISYSVSFCPLGTFLLDVL